MIFFKKNKKTIKKIIFFQKKFKKDLKILKKGVCY